MAQLGEGLFLFGLSVSSESFFFHHSNNLIVSPVMIHWINTEDSTSA